jgi:hypothetical protein
MILRQRGGPQIELTVLGYQFPYGVSDWHDLNWLNIFVRVQTVGASWTGGPDPCLLTTEARDLAAWLRAAANGSAVTPLEFLEPELSFAVARPPDDRVVPLAVTLKHAFVKDQTLVSVQLNELPLVLHVVAEDLVAAADELDIDLRRVPVRPVAP